MRYRDENLSLFKLQLPAAAGEASDLIQRNASTIAFDFHPMSHESLTTPSSATQIVLDNRYRWPTSAPRCQRKRQESVPMQQP